MYKVWKDKRLQSYYSNIETNDEFIRVFLGELVLNYIADPTNKNMYYPPQTPGKDDDDKHLRWVEKCYRNANIILTSDDDREVNAKLRWVIKNRRHFQ